MFLRYCVKNVNIDKNEIFKSKEKYPILVFIFQSDWLQNTLVDKTENYIIQFN